MIRAERATGGNSGIGMAIALKLARQGANIVIDYIAYLEAKEALEQQITALGGRAIGVEADVSKVADLQKLIGTTVAGFFGHNTAKIKSEFNRRNVMRISAPNKCI